LNAPKIISKDNNPKSPYFSPGTQDEVLPLIRTSIKLLYNLQSRIDDKSFQHMVNMVVGTTVNYIYLASENFLEKIDSFMFLLKNLIAFDQELFRRNIEVDWSEEERDSRNEGGLFDKLKTLNFFSSVSRKISSKLQDFNNNLKMPVHIHIEKISLIFVQDMSFIISKNLKDYLERYRYLEEQLRARIRESQEPEETKDNVAQTDAGNPNIVHVKGDRGTIESIKADMASLFTKETVQKFYTLYTDNINQILKEISEKMTNYMDENCQKAIGDSLQAIIEELINILHEFYILVAKEYPNEAYEAFKFEDVESVKAKLNSYFKF